MEYCCHVWAGATNCYLELLDKLQKWIYRITGPSLAACFKPSAHLQNVASLSLTLVGVHLNWLNWFYFLILEGALLVILIHCMIFLSPFLDVTTMSMSTVSFAQLASLSLSVSLFIYILYIYTIYI